MSVLKVKKNGQWIDTIGVISDADTLDGRHADEFALAGDVTALADRIGNFDATDALPKVTEQDNGALLGVIDGEWDKTTLPIEVSNDGYTSISGLRHATSINMTKNGNTIVIDTIYEGSVASETVITLDENDYPIAITTNGVECVISLEGFE